MIESGLIVAFDRDKELIKTLEEAISAGLRKIYIAIDGPKNSLQDIKQSKMRDEIRSIAIQRKVHVEIWQRGHNLGLAGSVISAIRWFFKYESEGIILEDDLKLSPYFVRFASRALREFSSDGRVLIISGNQFFQDSSNSSIRFTNYPLIWGWATNREKWNVLEALVLDQKSYDFSIRNFRRDAFWSIGALKSRARLLDSWAMPLAEGMLKGKYISVLPPRNLVINVGTGISATHTKSTTFETSQVLTTDEEIDFATNYHSNESLEYENKKLEKYVYRISLRNTLTPLKYYVMKNMILKSQTSNLKDYLQSITIP
jgi:hypothetical protein